MVGEPVAPPLSVPWVGSAEVSSSTSSAALVVNPAAAVSQGETVVVQTAKIINQENDQQKKTKYKRKANNETHELERVTRRSDRSSSSGVVAPSANADGQEAAEVLNQKRRKYGRKTTAADETSRNSGEECKSKIKKGRDKYRYTPGSQPPPPPKLRCHICQKQKLCRSKLLSHYAVSHYRRYLEARCDGLSRTAAAVKGPDGGGGAACPRCPARFRYYNSLLEHVAREHVSLLDLLPAEVVKDVGRRYQWHFRQCIRRILFFIWAVFLSDSVHFLAWFQIHMAKKTFP
jgi:uncharacterized C2H2 Zn-finger protein